MLREQQAQNRWPGGIELPGKSTNHTQIAVNQINNIASTTDKENMLPSATVQGGRTAERFGLPTEDVFSSPMILQELQQQRERESNAPVATRKVVVDAEGTPMMLSREQDTTAEVTTGEIGSRIPCADSSVHNTNYERKGGISSRMKSKIPKPSPSDVSSVHKGSDCGQSRLEEYIQGKMDTELSEANISLDGYSAYVNPLSFDEKNLDLLHIEQIATAGNMQMDTPEAFQLLQKLSAVQIDDLTNKGEVAVDWNLRTGPKKLSPEPSKDYEIKAPKMYGIHKNLGYISKKKKVSEGREENIVSDQQNGSLSLPPQTKETRVYSKDNNISYHSPLAPGFIRLGTMNSGTARGVYEPTTDEEDQQMKGIQGVDESGDENQISDEDDNKQLRMESEKRADVPMLASPVMHNVKAMACNHHATESDGQTTSESPEDNIPPTLNPSPRFKESRDISPVAFSLPPDSCDKEVCRSEKMVACEQENNSSDKASSFSFGHGGQAEPVDTQITAKLPNGEDKSSSAEESVDQPNPFVSMMGHLRHNGPESLQSPLGRGKVQHELPDTPGSHGKKQTTDSPASPSMCTPVNLISASAEEKSAPRTPDLGLGDLNAWIDHRGLSLITTPARRDLRKMWDAVRDLASTTENYRKAINLNEELKKEIEAARDAEAEARIAAKSGSEWAIAEIKKSEESASQMMSLANQIQQAFSLCEQEKRKLATELDQARETLERVERELRDSHGSADNVHAQKLLDSLSKAKELDECARKEANIVEEEAYNSQGRVLQVQERGQNDSLNRQHATPSDDLCMQSKPGIDTDSRVRSKVSFFESLAQQDSGLEKLLRSIEFMPASSEKSPLLMVPNTTPVDFDDTTTPYRIHMEAMHVLRQSLNQKEEETPMNDRKINMQTATPLEKDWDTSSDDNISEYDTVVSPINVESLTRLSRSTLRDKVRDRLIRLKTELQDAKNRLNHVEMGLYTPSMKKLNNENKFVQRSVQKEVRFSEHLTTTHHLPSRKDDMNLEILGENKGSNRIPEDVVDEILPEFASPATGTILEANIETFPDEQPENSREPVSQNENVSDTVSENGLDSCVQEPQSKMLQPGLETEDFTISASRPGGSTRSRFAMRYGDEFSTPKSKTPRRGAFTPQTGFSVARYTPTPQSSAASAASPSTHGFEPLRHRMWRGAEKKRHSDSEEKEFRRRAAALKIHVSPYFRKNRAAKNDRNELDTVL